MNRFLLGMLAVIALALLTLDLVDAPNWVLITGLAVAFAAIILTNILYRKKPREDHANSESTPAQRKVNLYNRVLMPLGGVVISAAGVGVAIAHLVNESAQPDAGWILLVVAGAILFIACLVFIVLMRRSAIRRTGHWV